VCISIATLYSLSDADILRHSPLAVINTKTNPNPNLNPNCAMINEKT